MKARSRHRRYLQSSEWADLRSAALERDGYRCRLCYSSGPLEVHHRRYPMPGEADGIWNLTTLCEICHGRHHRHSEADLRLAAAALLLGLIFGALCGLFLLRP